MVMSSNLSITNSGSGAQNVAAGTGAQYNNNSRGTQFNNSSIHGSKGLKIPG